MYNKGIEDVNIKICLIFSFLGFILSLIAIVTPYWIESYPEYKSQFIRLGLWIACFDGYEHFNDVSKVYTGCQFIYWPDYYYILDWLTPVRFVLVQIAAVTGFVGNFITLLVLCYKISSNGDLTDRTTNLLALASQFITVGCYLYVAIEMVLLSKSRLWLQRPDHNHVSWSYLFAVLACFCSLICFFHLINHWLIYDWAPGVISKQYVNFCTTLSADLTNGSTLRKPYYCGKPSETNLQTDTSKIYLQSEGPSSSNVGVTSGAIASSKVRKAMEFKMYQNPSTVGYSNNPTGLKNRPLKQSFSHAEVDVDKYDEYFGSISSLRSTSRRTQNTEYDTLI